MRGKRLVKNTIASLLYHIVAMVSGFVISRMILSHFGSCTNGLVSSLQQFLQVVAFLELGVGSVVQSSLYKPLAEKDNDSISMVVASADKFYKRIAEVLLIYILILLFVYPLFVNKEYGWIYTCTLLLSISISYFAQYYYGVVDRILLTSDQRGYISYNAQTATLFLNAIICIILIEANASIQLVKLATSIIYLLRPLYLHFYVNKNYKINRKIKYTSEPIKQKWNGIAQHIAAVVLDQTDVIILSLFSVLTNVSIYSVYNMIVYGIKQLFISMISGIQALMGELWAKKEKQKLELYFRKMEWLVHVGVTVIFGCVCVLVVPFVQVYTKGINDANYYQPIFGVLIVLANVGHCLRLPYNIMILATGHYRQTQANYIIAVLLNLGISIMAVRRFGLIGVTIGTLLAMAYQTIWMAWYNSKFIIKRSLKEFWYQVLLDVISFATIAVLCRNFSIKELTYYSWILLATKVVAISVIIVMVVNCFFGHKYVGQVVKKIMDAVENKENKL